MYELRSSNEKDIKQTVKVLNAMLEGVEVLCLCGVNLRNVDSFEIVCAGDDEFHHLIVNFKNGEYATTEMMLPDEVLKVFTDFSGVPYMNIAIMDNEDVKDC